MSEKVLRNFAILHRSKKINGTSLELFCHTNIGEPFEVRNSQSIQINLRESCVDLF